MVAENDEMRSEIDRTAGSTMWRLIRAAHSAPRDIALRLRAKRIGASGWPKAVERGAEIAGVNLADFTPKRDAAALIRALEAQADDEEDRLCEATGQHFQDIRDRRFKPIILASDTLKRLAKARS